MGVCAEVWGFAKSGMLLTAGVATGAAVWAVVISGIFARVCATVVTLACVVISSHGQISFEMAIVWLIGQPSGHAR